MQLLSLQVKVKGTVAPPPLHRGVESQIHVFLISALNGGEQSVRWHLLFAVSLGIRMNCYLLFSISVKFVFYLEGRTHIEDV
jgi:hypothetical protein